MYISIIIMTMVIYCQYLSSMVYNKINIMCVVA